MSFTTSLSTDIGKVRLELGDDLVDAGVLPDGSNLTDEQIQYYLDAEGSVMRAAAGICEMLARRFSGLVDITVGPRHESFSQLCQNYRIRAEELRKQFGGAGGGAFSFQPVKGDRYTTAQNEDEYAA